MKRVFLISILSSFIFSLLLAFSILYLKNLNTGFTYVLGENGEVKEIYEEFAYHYLLIGLLFLAGSLCTVALYALYAVKEFKVFQPYVERYRARKSERAAAKREKSVADKEKRLQELQAEIDELKKE